MKRFLFIITIIVIAASCHIAAQSNFSPGATSFSRDEDFLAWQAEQSPEAVADAVTNYNSAVNSHDNAATARAVERLCAHYVCYANRPELLAWSDKILSLPLNKNYERSIFNISRMHAALYSNTGEVDAIVRTARKCREEASELNSDYGMAIYYQIYSYALLKAGQTSSALDALSKALQIVQEIGNIPSEEFTIYVQIIDIHLLNSDLDTTEKLMPHLAELFNNHRNEFPSTYRFRYKQIIDFFDLFFYARSGNVDKASEIFAKLPSHDDIKTDHQLVFYRDRALWAYYMCTGNYDMALKFADYIIKNNGYIKASALQIKGELLHKLGREEEAIETLKLAYRTMAQNYSSNFGQELNEITLQQKQNDSQKLEQDLEIQKTRNTNNMIVACLIIILLIVGSSLMLTSKTAKLNEKLTESVAQLENERNDLVRRQFIIRESLDTTSNNAKVRATFLNNMSHEIRTPLNSIQGFGNLILQIADNKDQQEYASIICENSDYLLGLINNILDLGRLDAEKMKFEWGDYNLIEIITEASMLSKREPEVEFVMKADADTLMVHTDRARAIKVLANVFDNAYKYTHVGSVTAEVTRNGNHVITKIKDTGKGIPTEKSELIFERFEKLNPFDQGTGLGLSIARGIVERLGGSIKVDTSYRLGLCMVIDLPIGIEQNQSIDSTDSTAESGESQTTD